MAFIQQVHDFLTSFATLAKGRITQARLGNISYLDYLLYADEDACWAMAFRPSDWFVVLIVNVCSR